MRRPDENTLVVSLVEGPEILNGLKITRKFSEDGLQMVRIIALFDINNDAVNYIWVSLPYYERQFRGCISLSFRPKKRLEIKRLQQSENSKESEA